MAADGLDRMDLTNGLWLQWLIRWYEERVTQEAQFRQAHDGQDLFLSVSFPGILASQTAGRLNGLVRWNEGRAMWRSRPKKTVLFLVFPRFRPREFGHDA